MSNVNQAGTFRGDVLDRGMSLSSSGYPQLIVQLQAMEKWNQENGVWEPWNYEECEATAYLVLFGNNDKPTLNVRQVMKAFGWDGASFATPNDPDAKLADKIQFRIQASVYEGVERLKVEWVDAYDAEPGKKAPKLEAADIRKLDAQYAAALRNLGGGPKPKSAAPKPPDPTLAAAPAPVTANAAPIPTEEPPKPKRGRPKAPVPASSVAVTPPVAPSAPNPATPISQADAWQAVCNKAHPAGKTDMEITNAWIAEVNEAGGDVRVEDATITAKNGVTSGPTWFDIQVKTLARLGL